MSRARPRYIGHRLMFDGMAQLFDSIPVEHDPLLGPSPASTVTRGLDPVLVAPVTLSPATASAVTRGYAPIITIPAIGANGVYTFFCDLESGGSVTYNYVSDVLHTRGGYENRQSLTDYPRRTYEFQALLDDGQARDIKARLISNLAAAQLFNLALPHEGLTLVADAVGNTVFVNSTTLSDWCVPGRRVTLLAKDGTSSLDTIVASATANTILIAAVPGTNGLEGCLIMPTELVVLESAQGFGYHPTGLEVWSLKCVSSIIDPALGAIGTGATLVSFFTGAGGGPYPVWDYTISANELVQTTMEGMTEIEDTGGVPGSGAVQAFSDLTRSVGLLVKDDTRRQWMKKFWTTCRGRQVPFYLPTWKDDLIYDSAVSGTVFKIKSKDVIGGGDYTRWWLYSLAHRQLQIVTTTGVVEWVLVTSVTDNGDGTISVQVSAPWAGTIEHISFLELVRWDQDDLAFHYDGAISRVQLMARTVQR